MSRVTSKRQVTIPQKVAEIYGIRPGDDIEFEPAGDVIRVIPPRHAGPNLNLGERLRRFDQATERQVHRQTGSGRLSESTGRDWIREDLYVRGAD